MPNHTTVFNSSNVSEAWADVLDFVLTSRGAHAGPIVVEIDAQDGLLTESLSIRRLVNDELKKREKYSIDTTTSLIFPWKLWNMLGRPDLEKFSDIYMAKIFPALTRRGPRQNGHGTYFQRMIEFSGVNYAADVRMEKTVNQLKRILEIWEKAEEKGRHPRHSALQATIFDPAKDHHGAALCGFPCLQQVSFNYHDGLLTIGAYYPTQYLFDRGYGNYLGLCRLGQFMASQMGLAFDGLICVVGACQLGGGVTKSALWPLAQNIAAIRTGFQGPNCLSLS